MHAQCDACYPGTCGADAGQYTALHSRTCRVLAWTGAELGPRTLVPVAVDALGRVAEVDLHHLVLDPAPSPQHHIQIVTTWASPMSAEGNSVVLTTARLTS